MHGSFSTRMDSSLTELQTDIGRLTQQQEQIRRQFFLHGQRQSNAESDRPQSNNDTAKRKTWNVSSTCVSGSGGPLPEPPLRSHWGIPKPFGNTSSNNNGVATNSEIGDGTLPSVVYNGEVRTAPVTHYHSLKNCIADNANLAYSNSFRLHSNADTQGNRLFVRQPTA